MRPDELRRFSLQSPDFHDVHIELRACSRDDFNKPFCKCTFFSGQLLDLGVGGADLGRNWERFRRGGSRRW